MELRHEALRMLQIADPATKAAAVRALFAGPALRVDTEVSLAEPAGLPGRPDRPRLVAPKDVPTRSPFTTEGRAALLHSIAHIEFNAINYVLQVGVSSSGMSANMSTRNSRTCI